MWPNPQSPADLVTFNEQILNGKLHFLCSVDKRYLPLKIRSWLSTICFTCWFYVRSYYSNFPQTSAPSTQDVNWTYIRHSEDVQNVLCTFNLRSTSRVLWIWTHIIQTLQKKRITKWASHFRTTHICIWKCGQIWIISMPYTSVNSSKSFFLSSIQIFHYIQNYSIIWIALIQRSWLVKFDLEFSVKKHDQV